jgi:hypothetical protein
LGEVGSEGKIEEEANDDSVAYDLAAARGATFASLLARDSIVVGVKVKKQEAKGVGETSADFCPDHFSTILFPPFVDYARINKLYSTA